MRQMSAVLLAIVLAVCMLPANLLNSVMASEAVVSNGIPPSIKGYWEYIGTDLDPTCTTAWVRGNAYKLSNTDVGKEYMKNWIDTTSSMYKSSYEMLTGSDEKYSYVRDVRVAILYLPNCPYSKSLLPLFQEIAKNAGAKVMLIDASKYSVSILPYYDSINKGATSCTVLYLSATEKVAETGRDMPMGQTAVFSTAEFVKILKEAGYTNATDVNDASTYSYEEEYKELALMETNRQRIANGLLPVATTPALEKAAEVRAKEIVTKISHTRPGDLGYFNTAIDEQLPGVGYNYYLAENIAAVTSSVGPKGAVSAWMNSSGHRANLLNKHMTHIGIGFYFNTGSGYANNWIQIFLGNVAAQNLRLSQKSIEVIKGVPISDMDIDLVFESTIAGQVVESRIPLIDEMCEGYDSSQAGLQYVKVKYGNQSVVLEVEVGDFDPVPLTDDMVSFVDSVDNIVYDGRAKTPQVRVSNATGIYTLIEGYSYEISYAENINAGTASVTVTGKGNYTGTVTKTFTIQPKSISSMTLTGLESSYEYTGSRILPSVQLLDGSQKLYEGTDFTVSYGENVGTPVTNGSGEIEIKEKGTVTLSGMGNYTGTLTGEFSLKVPVLHNFASRFDRMLYFNSNAFSSLYKQLEYVYDLYLDAVKEYGADSPEASKAKLDLETPRRAYNNVNIDLEEAGYTIADVLAYSGYPNYQQLSEKLNDYFRFYAMIDGKITPEQAEKSDIQPAVVSEEVPVSNVTVEGLVPAAQTGNVSLAVGNASNAGQLAIDASQYDAVSAVALDIQMMVDGQSKQPETPVTITMDIPEGLNASDNLVVLHYHDGTSDPEKLAVTVKGNTMSFVTGKFSSFVVTREVESYSSGLTEPSQSNDPEQSGVSFGEEDNVGPEAPQNVTAVLSGKDMVTVSWEPAVQTEGWTINGYRVSWSQSEDFSSLLGSQEVDTQTGSLDISGLTSGRYYFKVTTLASSLAVSSMERDSLTASVQLSGSQNELPVYYTLTVHNGSGTSTAKYTANHVVELTADPAAEGMVFDCWKVEAGELHLSDATQSEITFYMPENNVVLRAVYRQLDSQPDEEPDEEQPGEEETPDVSEPDEEQPDVSQPDNNDPEENLPILPEYPDQWLPGGSTGGSRPDPSEPSAPEIVWDKDADGGTRLTIDGEMVTGWYQNDDGWYWFDQKSGVMSEDNWTKVDGVWYLFGKDGVMLTGWQKVDGKWYYLKDWGGMAAGWQQIDGVWYYLRSNGAMASDSWAQSGGQWYYLRGNGEMATNRWIQWKGDWYFLYSSGVMATNTAIDGYPVGSDGVWKR